MFNCRIRRLGNVFIAIKFKQMRTQIQPPNVIFRFEQTKIHNTRHTHNDGAFSCAKIQFKCIGTIITKMSKCCSDLKIYQAIMFCNLKEILFIRYIIITSIYIFITTANIINYLMTKFIKKKNCVLFIAKDEICF